MTTARAQESAQQRSAGAVRRRLPQPVIPRFQRLPALPQSAGLARRLAVGMLRAGNCRDPDAADAAALLTSELVGNAVTHGPSGIDRVIELTTWFADGHFWVAVADAGDRLPQPRHPPGNDEQGRGLLLVESLAAGWGVIRRPVVGKAVYFALPAPRPDTGA